jgi:hypothetical protein
MEAWHQRGWKNRDDSGAPMSSLLPWSPWWEAWVDSGAAASEENETRGVLRASLTMEGVSMVKADGNLVRWWLVQAPKLDKRQLGSERVLTPHKKVNAAVHRRTHRRAPSAVEEARQLGGKAAPRGVFLCKRGEGGEGMPAVTSHQHEHSLPVVASTAPRHRRWSRIEGDGKRVRQRLHARWSGTGEWERVASTFMLMGWCT